MSNYVMSDLHGEYSKFLEILDKLEFSNEDTLYVIGDIFDRGNDPLKILDFIRERNNIILLKGNHEQFFEEAYEEMIEEESDYESFNCWLECGGDTTFMDITNRGNEYMEELYLYIKSLPFIKVVKNYILVHGSLYLPNNYKELKIEEIINIQDEDYCLWNQDLIYKDEYIEDYIVVLGHTPTTKFDKKDPKIMKKVGKILIDCGAVYGGKVGCLRLEDLREFYVG